jgi:hypothetical protein
LKRNIPGIPACDACNWFCTYPLLCGNFALSVTLFFFHVP